MDRRGAKPGERRGGRQKGTRNRAELERNLIARNVAAAMQAMNGERRLLEAKSEAEAIAAEKQIVEAKRKQIPLAKDAMATFLGIFMSRASFYNSKGVEPDPADSTGKTLRDKNPHANESKFEKWAMRAVETAKALAPYQSPTYRAVLVAPAPPESTVPRRFTLTIHDSRNGNAAIVQTNAPATPAIIDAIANEEDEDEAGDAGA
jgi:hypothetical protein